MWPFNPEKKGRETEVRKLFAENIDEGVIDSILESDSSTKLVEEHIGFVLIIVGDDPSSPEIITSVRTTAPRLKIVISRVRFIIPKLFKQTCWFCHNF